MRDVDNIEVQKKRWGRDGHGIPGVIPNYAGRARVLGAAGVLILAGGAFALVTGGHTESATAARYVADVARGDSMQSQFDQSIHNSPARSLTIVHDLVQTLRKEDQRLSTQHWPGNIRLNMEFFIHENKQDISDLKNYASASSSKRVVLLNREYEDAHQSEYMDSVIRDQLDATSTVT
jgi:hypothetical protein